MVISSLRLSGFARDFLILTYWTASFYLSSITKQKCPENKAIKSCRLGSDDYSFFILKSVDVFRSFVILPFFDTEPGAFQAVF